MKAELDADWLDIKDGRTLWQVQGVTRVTGFLYREPRTYEARTPEDHERNVNRLLYRTEVVSLKVGNEEQLRVSPIKLETLFTARHLDFPNMAPGITLTLELLNCPGDIIWQIRPIGLCIL
jgi:hypothetical protein